MIYRNKLNLNNDTAERNLNLSIGCAILFAILLYALIANREEFLTSNNNKMLNYEGKAKKECLLHNNTDHGSLVSSKHFIIKSTIHGRERVLHT
jgi:hypothetical protein